MIKWAVSLAKHSSIARKTLEDARFRTTVFACESLFINLAYAAFNGFLGISNHSFWFITLFVYYSILAIMRFYAVTYEFKKKPVRTEHSVMRFCGLWVCFLAVVLSGMVCLNVSLGRNDAKHTIVMITIATYTFYKTTMAIVNIIKVRKKHSPLLTTLRNINCVDATVSMLALEHSMISTFMTAGESRFMFIMDVSTGAVAFLIVLALGISMSVAGGILPKHFLDCLYSQPKNSPSPVVTPEYH